MDRLGMRATMAATSLIIVQLVMLASLYAKSVPHPPAATPFFALGPFFAASLAITGAALVALLLGAPSALACALAGVTGLVSFGPQKWFDPAIGAIWPAVVVGQVAALVMLAAAVAIARRPRTSADAPGVDA